ncbi:MAG: hypothetical protein Q9220_007254 [cf. Caloplaca sp. 1 TL-2023]
MQNVTGLERPNLSTTRSQRSSSISNDRASLSVNLLSSPPPVSPDPAYIAPSSASQIVTGDRHSILQEEDEEEASQSPEASNTLVASNALQLINSFLDQLLYSFLVSSHSTSIAALRPAVIEVLKPRLAKEAIASADEELQEFLGAGDEEELAALDHDLDLRSGWDLNTIWRRTRLRCMVYTRLGDLEEEDEEMWIAHENASQQVDRHHRLSRDLGVVSPAAAIFLTSILEFVGEQALLLAAEAAYMRFEGRRRQEKYSAAGVLGLQRLSVEVVDIEKLALNTTFGRLWRSWKKKARASSFSSQKLSSSEHLLRPTSSLSSSEARSRKPSSETVGDAGPDSRTSHPPPVSEDSDGVREAAAVPLPLMTNDLNEIHEPDLPKQGQRPRSMMTSARYDNEDHESEQNRTQNYMGSRPSLLQHNRSSSLPHLAPRQYPYLQETEGSLYGTPREAASSNSVAIDSIGLARSDTDSAAVTTMYDGAIMREEGTTENLPKYNLQDPDPSTQENLVLQRKERLTDTPDNNMGAVADFNHLDSSAISSDARAHSSSLPHSRDPKEVASAGSRKDSSGNFAQQQLPSRVESRLDSPRMQGHPSEELAVNNRETSIAETAYPYPGEKHGALSGSDGVSRKISQSTEDHDYAASRFNTSNGYANLGRVDERTIPEYGQIPRSQLEMAANRSDARKQLPPVSTGAERASVQRVSPLESPVGRTSTSSSRDIRALHSTNSTASQRAVKTSSVGSRESGDISRQYATSRKSSEGSGSLASPSLKTPKIEETQRSFEQLINSDQTIQYTLTPQSVREIDSPDSPRKSHSRTGTAELADFIRTSGPPAQADLGGRPSTSRSIVSLKGLNGLRSNPSANAKQGGPPITAPLLEEPHLPKELPRPTTARSAHGVPRDAHLDPETTRDFADFIRSTGPEKSQVNVRDQTTLPPSSMSRTSRGMTPDQRSTSTTSVGRKITKPNPSVSKSPPPVTQFTPPKRTAAKLQAREATYQPTHNEDLLDFLKQGPADDRGIEKSSVPGPVASVVPQNPPIPSNLRARASDNTRSSVASTQDSSFAARSVRSTNSRTGLLDNSRGPYGGSSPPLSQRPSTFNEPPQMVRKQRRVKDPYAIDTDSENEDHPPTLKPQRQEESLIDFLNSTPPPPNQPKVPSAFDDMPDLTIRNTNMNSPNQNNTHPLCRPTNNPSNPGISSYLEPAAISALSPEIRSATATASLLFISTATATPTAKLQRHIPASPHQLSQSSTQQHFRWSVLHPAFILVNDSEWVRHNVRPAASYHDFKYSSPQRNDEI